MTHSPMLRGKHVSLAYAAVFEACGFRDMLHRKNNAESECVMVARLEVELKKLVDLGDMMGEACALVLSSGPFYVERFGDRAVLRSDKHIFACHQCDAVSEPQSPLYPGSRHVPHPRDWSFIEDKGTVYYYCPSCEPNR
jgi:hypothetical protein